MKRNIKHKQNTFEHLCLTREHLVFYMWDTQIFVFETSTTSARFFPLKNLN